nr:unnamed protein product [Haemonchus contortus]
MQYEDEWPHSFSFTQLRASISTLDFTNKLTRENLPSRGSMSFIARTAGQLRSTFVVRRSERGSEVDAVVTENSPFFGTGRFYIRAAEDEDGSTSFGVRRDMIPTGIRR